jgi:hypothetical protein
MIRVLLCSLALAMAAPDVEAAKPQRLLLEYDGGAYGVIPLGRATLDLSLDADGAYRAGATIRSSGLAALFDTTRLEAEALGRVQSSVLGWTNFRLDHAYARKRRVTYLQPTADDVAAMITPTFSDAGNPPPTPAQRREARDPLSSLMAMAVQVGMSGRCDGTFPTFDGRYRYDLTLRRVGEGRFEAEGFDGRVQRCRIRYRPVAGYRTPRDMEKRIPEGEIWFALDAADGYAPPVRMAAPLPLGWAAIRLKTLRRADVVIEPEADDPSSDDRAVAP